LTIIFSPRSSDLCQSPDTLFFSLKHLSYLLSPLLLQPSECSILLHESNAVPPQFPAPISLFFIFVSFSCVPSLYLFFIVCLSSFQRPSKLGTFPVLFRTVPFFRRPFWVCFLSHGSHRLKLPFSLGFFSSSFPAGHSISSNFFYDPSLFLRVLASQPPLQAYPIGVPFLCIF